MSSGKAAAAVENHGYQIVYRKAAELVPYARNSRTHTDEQIAKIMASLREFGWTNPVLIDEDDGIVAGHGRVMAALRMYEAGKTIKLPNGTMLANGVVPVLDCTGWSDAQKRAYIIADNAIAAEAGWDADLLKLELGDLTATGFNLDLLGFSADNLAAALGPQPKDKGEDYEEEPVPDGYAEQFGVVVVCRDAAHQEEVYNQLEADGFNVKVVVT